jgi:hypothetical protein
VVFARVLPPESSGVRVSRRGASDTGGGVSVVVLQEYRGGTGKQRRSAEPTIGVVVC